MVQSDRIRKRNAQPPSNGPVIYWMSRDQRVRDNWALICARDEARRLDAPLAVVFCLIDSFIGAERRQFDFMRCGLRELAADLERLNIPFLLLPGEPSRTLPSLLRTVKAGLLISDFDPLRIKRRWKQEVESRIDTAFWEVDAHNIVPCPAASNKQEYGAYTLRPKIHRLLPHFLEPFPQLRRQPVTLRERLVFPKHLQQASGRLLDASPARTEPLPAGERAAARCLHAFITGRLSRYDADRNDPTKQGTSGLSGYLHFGQISAQRIALDVEAAPVNAEAREVFLEELIVRRELADNYCWYNAAYDTPEGFPDWAKRTHALHRDDPRPYIYSAGQLESAATHEALWNAAQTQLIDTGSMHGYLRMYWAKKILEWTPSVEAAQEIAISLNDRYQFDGRDPNGYTGIAWSMGGVHDRAWPERLVFGKIRYMNENGSRRKFDTDRYISTHSRPEAP